MSSVKKWQDKVKQILLLITVIGHQNNHLSLLYHKVVLILPDNARAHINRVTQEKIVSKYGNFVRPPTSVQHEPSDDQSFHVIAKLLKMKTFD